jgi:hypothetical protein
MLTDGIKRKSLEDQIKQLDVVELLDQSCEPVEVLSPPPEPPAPAPPPPPPPPPAEAPPVESVAE